MNLLTYLVGLVLVSIIAGACLAAILIYFNPFTSGLLVFILFYLSLFIASTSVFTLIGWIIRIISKKRKFPLPKKEAIYRFEVSFRQGMFLSAIFNCFINITRSKSFIMVEFINFNGRRRIIWMVAF